MDKNTAYWFAIHTRSRHEKHVDIILREKNIKSFLPLIQTISRRKDRRKTIHVPLFPGYLFVNISMEQLYEVISTRGVAKVIGRDRFEPSPIPEKQIEDIKTLINSNVKLDPYRFLQKGTRVRVKSGPLMGVEGILVKRKTDLRVVVSISLLQKSTAAEVYLSDIETLD